MHYRTVSEKDQALLEPLDPFFRFDRLVLPGFVGIAAVKKKGRREILAGALLYSDIKRVLTIEWVGVAEDYRCRGIGETLIGKVFELAVATGRRFVRTYMPKNSEWLRECPFAREYLEERYFTVSVPAPGEWQSSLQAIGGSAFFKQTDKTALQNEGLCRLSEYPISRQRQIITEVGSHPESCLFCSVTRPEEMAADISVVAENMSRVVGAAFVSQMGEDLCLSAFFAERNVTARALLAAVYAAAAKKYPPDTYLLSAFREEGFEKLFGDFYGRSEEGELMIADMKEYLADMGRLK